MKITTVIGDLFSSKTALAHCVSVDMNMGKGIAVRFKRLFGQVDNLIGQHAGIGEVAILWDDKEKRYIYYLVTKAKYYGKPTYDSLEASIVKMKEHMVANKVKELSIPTIGCGLDKLKWKSVQKILKNVFQDTDVNITVYKLK